MKQIFRIFCVFLLAYVFPYTSFAQDALEKLFEQREAFRKTFQEHGMSVRFEQYVGTRANIWDCQVDGDYVVMRLLGRDIDSPFDDTIGVVGPSYSFVLQVVKGDSGDENYSLSDIVPTGKKLPEESVLAETAGVAEDAGKFPWQFEGRDLEFFRDQYEVFQVTQPNAEEVWVEFSGPKDVAPMIYHQMCVFLQGKLIFRADHDWQLSRAEWSCDNYNSVGKKTESFSATRDYFSRDGEFGHGIFENGKFIDGTDELSVESTLSFGRRMTWKPIDIDPAIFTPEYYGIDPGIGLAKKTNWLLWIVVVVSVVAIVSGLWLRRRALRAA